MRLKGKMIMELTDEATGVKETIEEENMVTDSVNNILGLNPMGIFYKATDKQGEITDWSKGMLPICPNLIGGILLFEKRLDEDAGNIYPKSDNLPVAYASNNANPTANTARGSLSLSESKALENGYKFVWEFLPSQGNCTIAAVALTSAKGGEDGFGSMTGDSSVFQKLCTVDVGTLSKEDQMMLFEAVEMDFEKELLFSITYEESSVRVRKIRIPIFTVGLNEKLDDTTCRVLEDQTIHTDTFKLNGAYAKKYGDFIDGQDGYWYGFSNNENSMGDAKVLWVKIAKEGYTKTEGEWTLSDAKLMEIGTRNKEDTYPVRTIKSCIRKGYLYVPAYDKNGIYKIKIDNPTDITLISLGFTTKWKPLSGTGNCEMYMALVGDLIIGYDFQIKADGTVIQTQGSERLNKTATPLFQHKNFLIAWGGSYGKEDRTAYLLTPYLATINNLSEAVVKTADKTMKITYTLTEEAE